MQNNSPFKNWKSLIAFLLFLIVYGYGVFTKMEPDVIATTGNLALAAMAFMMLRNEHMGKVVEIIAQAFKKKIGK